MNNLLFPPQTEWIIPETFPDLSQAKEIAIDLETSDPNMDSMGPGWPIKNGFIVGFAFAVSDWKGYFPIKHQGGGNLDETVVRNFVHDVLNMYLHMQDNTIMVDYNFAQCCLVACTRKDIAC